MIGNYEEIGKWLFSECDKNKLYEVKEYNPKRRSLTANAYYWVLLRQLAVILHTSNEELHFLMLQRYGDFTVVSVLKDIDVYPYFKYCKAIGTGIADGKEFVHYAIYKRSSAMNSKEFSVLLDGLISECEEVGIPTLASDEVAKLKYIEMRKK